MSALSSGRIAAILFALVFTGPAAGQTVCRLEATPGQPDRQVLQCGDTVQVEGAPGARFQPVNRDSDPLPEAVEVEEGRILARVHGRNPATSVGTQRPPPFEFQIRTPHAVASVRGTVWAVGVEGARTSIYVKDGSVRIERTLDDNAATMVCNEGVDIAAGERGELVPHEWARSRSDLFLEPFGLRGGCPPTNGRRERGDNHDRDDRGGRQSADRSDGGGPAPGSTRP